VRGKRGEREEKKKKLREEEKQKRTTIRKASGGCKTGHCGACTHKHIANSRRSAHSKREKGTTKGVSERGKRTPTGW